jgi:chromosome segregation protein
MRRLLRLSIEGFKTFAGRTDLDLGPGMTAVVGPNGSGKSNLIDAIAWAVGSRSWKSLRGDGMEDVLFHGSDREPAAPVARVTVSFDNEDRLLGIDFSEVSVTREIVRGGGSRVLLNGVEARLKDVQTVLSGTGLTGGFSLIRQGSVDRLVLAPPADVGRWIEESANIAGYRARKQEAVDRLRKAEAHAAEAERRSASLKRELGQVKSKAEKARVRRRGEERCAFLRKALAGCERRRLRVSLDAVDAEANRLRAGIEEASGRRKELTTLRRRLEEGLQPSDPAPSRAPGRITEKVARIREAAEALASVGDRLRREGSVAWPAAVETLGRVAAMIEAIRHPGSPARAFGDVAAVLSDLRDCARDLDAVEREAATLASDLAGRQCERARLEERLAALGEPSENERAEIDPEPAAQELEELTRELAQLGPVDETAEMREGDIARELAELAPLLQDLAVTRSQLSGFIRQMEQVTSRLFAGTLAEVDARFRQYCAVLFHGGEARLERAVGEGDDALVDVRIRLPRKPETSLALLSGGERSLAGLALILALAAGAREEGRQAGRLLILDEVDAALDEANAARLALLLRELQQNHQILCVTHNRSTMRQASRLVGVAARSASVSTLVKVELDRLARDGSAA